MFLLDPGNTDNKNLKNMSDTQLWCFEGTLNTTLNGLLIFMHSSEVQQILPEVDLANI